MVMLAWVLSENRKAAPWRLVVWGVALQFAIGLVILKTPLKGAVFSGMQQTVHILTSSTLEGATMVFGSLSTDANLGALFAFQVLPVIIFVSTLAAILHHLRVIQFLVTGIAWVMRRTLKTSGAETFAAGLLIFMGIEAVSAVRGYVKGMTRSELFTVLSTFMATIAGSVLVIYASFGAEPGHLLSASLMSAPAAIVIAKIMVPELGTPATSGETRVAVEVESTNLIDAAARGVSQGLNMALQVGAMVLAFVATVYLLDLLLKGATGWFLDEPLTFSRLMAFVFYPFAVLLGVPLGDAGAVAQLIGKKTVLNEFLAYLDLKAMIEQSAISPRARMIATYALCGFANPGSMAIGIAGLDVLAPERRSEICALSVKSLVAGTLACLMTACVAGVISYE